MKARTIGWLLTWVTVASLVGHAVSQTGDNAPRGDSPAILAVSSPTAAVGSHPEPAPRAVSLVLEPGSRVRVLSYEQWRAIRDAFPEEQEFEAARTAFCESGFDPASSIIDTNGLVSAGAWHVQAHWWGKVPPTLEAQARQVAAIVAEHGWAPFMGERGCSEWSVR